MSRRKHEPRAGGPATRLWIEALEVRALLSAAATTAAGEGTARVMAPDLEHLAPDAVAAAAGSTTVDGYTPAEIRKAYGFDDVTLGTGSVAADGRGQTIAIVDAFNDPNIAADLAVFDAQFGLSAASLKVVNQTGGSKLPATDAGWAGEIALDVEWAHAVAPAASILLVEATSDSTDDLMAAVDYARHAAGVSVVSMSWGGSEYVGWGGGESASQLALDKTFTTPAGHAGVTFIAAAGDSGQSSGVQWPSSSPNVMAVGGTSLDTSADGTYADEGAWRGSRDGTSGGFSRVEAEPDYQQVAQQTGARSTPDVGYDADPNTGFAVYDSVAYEGESGWAVIGGTSAGSPQWAGLVAIADQGRALAGLGTLDGPTGTLPDLYALYSAPGTAGYDATYTKAFHDIGDDGYGYTTGLGSPYADVVVAALVGTSAGTGTGTGTGDGSTTGDAGGDTGDGSTGDGSTAGGTGATADLPASPLAITLTAAPASGLTGRVGSVAVRLTNVSGQAFDGPVTVTLYASADAAVSADDATLATVSLSDVRLKAGAAKTVKVKFTFPTDLADGAYTLIASVAAPTTVSAAAQATAPLAVAAPRADLSTTFATAEPITVDAGHPSSTVEVTITNAGNVAAAGPAVLSLFASADAALDGADAFLASLRLRGLRLKAGESKTVRVRLKDVAGLVAGRPNLIASLAPAAQLADADAADNVAVRPIV